MNENKKTAWYLGVAGALLVLALVLSPSPPTPEAFSDQGEEFFPAFEDPNSARTLEVIKVDTETGAPEAFKVTFTNGHWTIPSHHNYPADAADRLANTAAGVIDIRKDEFRSANVADHDAMGVRLPTDETAPPDSRGQRITLRGENGETLADLVIGKDVADKPGFRFVRYPDQKRVYAAKVDVDLSTRFADWIETDLLKVEKSAIDRMTILDYSIDERTGRMSDDGQVVLSKSNDTWSAGKAKADSAVVQAMLTAVDELSIVGVRPKPEALARMLSDNPDKAELDQNEMRSLQSAGFFVGRRDGRLLANEGELLVRNNKGILYTLRFGEVVYGTGMAVTAGTESGEQSGNAENRYLLVTAEYDPSANPEPGPLPTDRSFQDKPDSLKTAEDHEAQRMLDKHARWQRETQQARERVRELNERFADWYYVIPSESYQKLSVSRSDVIAGQS